MEDCVMPDPSGVMVNTSWVMQDPSCGVQPQDTSWVMPDPSCVTPDHNLPVKK